MSVHTRPPGAAPPAHECAPPEIAGPPPPPGRWTCRVCGSRFSWRTARAKADGELRLVEGWHPLRRGGEVLRVENLAAAYAHEQQVHAAPWWAWRYKARQRRQARFLRRLEGQR